MNRRMVHQPFSSSSSSTSSSCSSISSRRPSTTNNRSSPHKTISRRAQRRILQLVDVEEDHDANPEHGRSRYSARHGKRCRKNYCDRLKYYDDMQLERIKRGSPTMTTIPTPHSRKEPIVKEELNEAYNDAHDRIETIIKDYSNEIKRINEQLRDAPTMSDIHSDNEFGLRKATGAIRYHNKSTLIGKSRRRVNGGVINGYQGKSQALAYFVNRDRIEATPLLNRPTRLFFRPPPTGDRNNVESFTKWYHTKIGGHYKCVNNRRWLTQMTDSMNRFAHQMKRRSRYGHSMVHKMSGPHDRYRHEVRHAILARPHVC
jgi:hypothetical protein